MNKNGTVGQSGNLDERLDTIKESVKGFVDQGQERVDHLKTRVIDAKDKAMSRGGEYVERATDMIRANPIKAVGLAFGIGYIGMRLFRR